MSYTLAAAATATGTNKTTILRAIKSGKISAAKDEHGCWHDWQGGTSWDRYFDWFWVA
jgi:hypothetical protein